LFICSFSVYNDLNIMDIGELYSRLGSGTNAGSNFDFGGL
jgi:hypothetical protein